MVDSSLVHGSNVSTIASLTIEDVIQSHGADIGGLFREGGVSR